ncbi:MAG: hypothetical protein KJO09_10270 [Gammaproteobacteria bacterium]|nr:hypothetical protein [Gammaproteobacteria bacterium]
MKETPENNEQPQDRWTLARDIAVLQVKLLADGLRDLLLVPASLTVGLVSLFSSENGRPAPYFYQLLDLGKQTERWINLFGALKNAPPDVRQVEPFPDADIDDLVGRLETFMVDEHKRGGLTAQAQERMGKVIKAMQRARKPGSPVD